MLRTILIVDDSAVHRQMLGLLLKRLAAGSLGLRFAQNGRDALAILDKYGIAILAAVRDWLANPRSETPKPRDPAFAQVRNRIIMSSRTVLARGMSPTSR